MKRAEILSVVNGDGVRRREAYDVEVSGRVVRMYHGDAVLVGTEAPGEQPDRPACVSIAVMLPGCPCGCKSPSKGIEFIPTPEHARLLAKQLIEAAADVEAAATLSASELIAKARGR